MIIKMGAVPSHDDLWFAARMTQIQLEALAKRCECDKSLRELILLPTFVQPHPPRNVRIESVEPWLFNGWNTECVLRLSRTIFSTDALRTSIQWGFPQAYYSAYALTLASFIVEGYTESSHRSVIAKYGTLAIQSKYPTAISFALVGPPHAYVHHHLAPTRLRNSSQFDRDHDGIVDAQIAQFLNSTRAADLKEKKQDMALRTRKGTRKHGFNKQDWLRTSDKLGPTSLLSLLYRKRIKANYRDIETFLSPNLDAEKTFDALISVVQCMNCIHEALIWKGLGDATYSAIVERANASSREFVSQRLEKIRHVAVEAATVPRLKLAGSAAPWGRGIDRNQL